MSTICLLSLLVSTLTHLPCPINPSSSTEDLRSRPENDIVLRIDAYLTRIEAMGFSGAILIEYEGEVALRKGYGLADRESRKPYTPETVQTMGSITKQMTGAAILLLEQQGLLTTDDPITKFFDRVPEDKSSITIHHLLTHQGGMPGSIGRDAEAIDAVEYLVRAMDTPLDFEPGSRYDYSNVGYSLLGIIIEKVMGKGYEEYMREEVLLPSGLSHTGYILPDWPEGSLAVGYYEGDHWGRIVDKNWMDDGPGWHLRANGGLHTTIDDMHRWLDVLRGNGLLNSTQVERWTTGYVDEGFGDSHYAYGWAIHDTEIGKIIAHNGGNGIFSADFVWVPEHELFFYVHGNTSVVEAGQIREEILRAAFDPEFIWPPAVPVDAQSSPSNADTHAGRYRMEGGTIEMKTDDIRLLATVSGQPAIDEVMQHGTVQRERFTGLNELSMRALMRIGEGHTDAFDGIVPPDTDADARAQRLIERFTPYGQVQKFELIGTVANVPGSRLVEYGDASTLVRAEFAQRTRILSVLWNADNQYAGTAIGPLSDIPSYVLIPVHDGAYIAVEREAPFRTAAFAFEKGCLVTGRIKVCKE